MITQTILKDYAGTRQPRLQLLSEEEMNWRLYWNVQKEPETQGQDPESAASEQWSADYVPQSWQSDVISDIEPDPSAFRSLLSELNLSDEEIDAIIDE